MKAVNDNIQAMATVQPLFDDRITLDKCEEYRRARIEDDDSGGSSTTDDQSSGTYAEMVQEVEKVSDLLIQTQSRLWETQDEITLSNEKVVELEANLKEKQGEIDNLRQENCVLLDEEQKLRDEVSELEKGVIDRDAGRRRPLLEERLKKAVEFLKKDLANAEEKCESTAANLRDQKALVESLQQERATREQEIKEAKHVSLGRDGELSKHRCQLDEAREENATLVEEIASLREELQRSNCVVEKRDELIRQEVAEKVEERVKLQVRETVTQQVTERVTKKVTLEMKVIRDKDISALRDQLKKIMKENSILQENIEDSQDSKQRVRDLEEEAASLKYDIQRYMALLDASKREQELSVSKLESSYRLRIQHFREELTKEKWSNAAEIRNKISAEREQEVNEFVQRIETLSRQTDRMLEKSEMERKDHVQKARSQICREKDKEIQLLERKVDDLISEKESLMVDTKKIEQEFISQVRHDLEQKVQQDEQEYLLRIDDLAAENDLLKRQTVESEGKLDLMKKEGETTHDMFKSMQYDLQSSRHEITSLEERLGESTRQLQEMNLQRDLLSTELGSSKKLFREALVKSESQNSKLKRKIKDATGKEPMTTESLVNRLELEISCLKQELHEVERSLQAANADKANRDMEFMRLRQAESENQELQQKIQYLEEVASSDGADEREDITNKSCSAIAAVVQGDNEMLHSVARELSRILSSKRAEAEELAFDSIAHGESSSNGTEAEILKVKEQVQRSSLLLANYWRTRSDSAEQLSRLIASWRDPSSTSFKSDTMSSGSEIKQLERLLTSYGESVLEPAEKTVPSNTRTALMDANDQVCLLKEENDELVSKLEELQNTNEQGNWDAIQWQEEVDHLKFLLGNYRNELRQTKEELEKSQEYLESNNVYTERIQELEEKNEVLRQLLMVAEGDLATTIEDLASARGTIDELVAASGADNLHHKKQIDRLVKETEKHNLIHQQKLLNAQKSHQSMEEMLELSNADRQTWKIKWNEAEREKSEMIREHSRVKHELIDIENQLKEELIRSEQNASVLREKLVTVGLDEEETQMSMEIEASKQQLEQALLVIEGSSSARIKELEDLLHRADRDNLNLSEQLRELTRSPSGHTTVNKKPLGEQSASDLLKVAVRENSVVVKQLGHSRKLFQEALMAWREEVAALRDEYEPKSVALPLDSMQEQQQNSLASFPQSQDSASHQTHADSLLPLSIATEPEASHSINADSLAENEGQKEGNLPFSTGEVCLTPCSQNDSISSELFAKVDNFLAKSEKKRVMWKDKESVLHSNDSYSTSSSLRHFEQQMRVLNAKAEESEAMRNYVLMKGPRWGFDDSESGTQQGTRLEVDLDDVSKSDYTALINDESMGRRHPTVEGRAFENVDDTSDLPSRIVNESLADESTMAWTTGTAEYSEGTNPIKDVREKDPPPLYVRGRRKEVVEESILEKSEVVAGTGLPPLPTYRSERDRSSLQSALSRTSDQPSTDPSLQSVSLSSQSGQHGAYPSHQNRSTRGATAKIAQTEKKNATQKAKNTDYSEDGYLANPSLRSLADGLQSESFSSGCETSDFYSSTDNEGSSSQLRKKKGKSHFSSRFSKAVVTTRRRRSRRRANGSQSSSPTPSPTPTYDDQTATPATTTKRPQNVPAQTSLQRALAAQTDDGDFSNTTGSESQPLTSLQRALEEGKAKGSTKRYEKGKHSPDTKCYIPPDFRDEVLSDEHYARVEEDDTERKASEDMREQPEEYYNTTVENSQCGLSSSVERRG